MTDDPFISTVQDQCGAVLSVIVTTRDGDGNHASVQYNPAELLALLSRLAAVEQRAARLTAERDALLAVVKWVARQKKGEGR